MLLPVRLLIVTAILLSGCTTTKKVAVSSFRVIDTPAHYIRKKIDASDTTTTTTTTTTGGASDVVTNPGAPVAPVTQTATTEQRVASQSAPKTADNRSNASTTVQHKSAPATTTHPSSAVEFPTARPVPGKPGFVYSVDPKGGIVDVTGYKSGDKAKDPYTQQIFIVP
jgi:hypothetical protein